FNVTGMLTATGVQKYLPKGVVISPPTAVMFVSMDETGKWDYGVQKLGARVLALPGCDEVDMGFDASWTKALGLSVHADVKKIKLKNFTFDGFVNVEKGQFKDGQLHAAADFPGIGLDGLVTVKPSDMAGLTIDANLTVTPKGGAFGKFIKDGSLLIQTDNGKIKKVHGEVNLKPPEFLKDLH